MRSQNVIPSLFLDFMQMQQFAKDPMVFAEGKGIRLTDVDGKSYIDGLSGVFTASLGHGNEAVIEAMSEQLKRLAFAPPLELDEGAVGAPPQLVADRAKRMLGDVEAEALLLHSQQVGLLELAVGNRRVVA